MVLGPEEVGLGPEELFRPVLCPDDSDSGMLDAAVELIGDKVWWPSTAQGGGALHEETANS